MAQRIGFEGWLAALSADLAGIGIDDWIESIASVLGRLTEYFELDGCCLWQLRRDGELRLFAAHGCDFVHDDVPSAGSTRWLTDLLISCRETQAFPSLARLPAQAAADRAALAERGVGSLLLVPLALDGQIAAWLLVVSSAEREWHDDLQRRLGLVAGLVGNTMARLQAQRAALQEQARFMQLLRAAPDAIVVVRSDGCIEYINDQAEQLFGYRSSELEGRPIEILVPDHWRRAHRRHRRTYIESPRVRAMGPDRALHAAHKSGALIPVEISLSPVDTDDGAMVTAIVRDITERKRAEEKVREQRNELARVSRIATVGELAGALAHELNQPLAAILSNAQAAQRFLRRDEPDTEQVRQIVTDIIEDDRRAAAVIHQMRRFLKHEEPELRDIALNRLITDTLRALQSDLAINQVSVETELDEDLPAVLGNLVQLQQVVLNLVLNAVDAMQPLAHVDRMLTLRTAGIDGTVCIEVCDRGPGIDPAIVNKIFGPFFTTKKDGMGMGLPITRSIVEAHGGSLTVSNNADQGCTFRVVLPVACPDANVRSA